jgi:hypothetical protein
MYKVSTTNGPGTESVDSFSSGVSYGVVWNYYVKSGTTNFRTGRIEVSWDGSTVQMNETSTQDIGSTIDIEFDVILSGGNIVINSEIGAGTWEIKVVRMII